MDGGESRNAEMTVIIGPRTHQHAEHDVGSGTLVPARDAVAVGDGRRHGGLGPVPKTAFDGCCIGMCRAYRGLVRDDQRQ